MKWAYRTLVRFYPYDFRAAFSAEMIEAFAGVSGHRRVPELAGLLTGIAAEWIAKFTTNPAVRGRALPDLRMMRPVGMPREIWFAGTGCWSDTWR